MPKLRKPEIDDFLLVGGAALVSTGLGMVFLPLALIFAGLCLLGLGLLTART